MTRSNSYLCLDVGTVRIGVAIADTIVRIAIPYGVVDVDGTEIEAIARLVIDNNVKIIVVGYPRNQSGDVTPQTELVETFTDKLSDLEPTIVYQDESVTSIIAEDRLKARHQPYTKGDVDAEAATIILQDYLESHA